MSGSIRQRGKSGNHGSCKFEAPADPRRASARPVHRSFRGTKRQAEARLIELQSEAARGGLVDHSRETLKRILDSLGSRLGCDQCLSENARAMESIAGPSDRASPWRRAAAAHQAEPLAELYSSLMREGGVGGKPLAPVTVGHCHRLLRRALGHALTWGLIQQNPAAVARPPRVPDAEIEIPTEIEIAAVLGHLRERDRQLYTLGLVALATGARRGELCGLCWKDFDADAGMLRIERSFETTAEQGLRVKGPKTKHGRRAISLSASAVETLRAHWKAQGEERLGVRARSRWARWSYLRHG